MGFGDDEKCEVCDQREGNETDIQDLYSIRICNSCLNDWTEHSDELPMVRELMEKKARRKALELRLTYADLDEGDFDRYEEQYVAADNRVHELQFAVFKYAKRYFEREKQKNK